MSSSTSPYDDLPDDSSAHTTPTTSPTQTSFSPGRLVPHRTFSQTSQWSMAETPSYHHQGTSYFPSQAQARGASPTPRRGYYPQLTRAMSSTSVRRPRNRSTSITSSRAPTRYRDDEDLLGEEEEDLDSDRREGNSRHPDDVDVDPDDGSSDNESGSEREEDPITVKERQSLINVEHPFGLPIWKPALYKKSRSVTRYADQALHSVPSAQAERHLLPGNIFWAVAFGWWLALVCLAVSLVLYIVPLGGKQYSNLVFGLGWYIVWPFGKYVEGEIGPVREDEEAVNGDGEHANSEESTSTLRLTEDTESGAAQSANSTVTPRTVQHSTSVSWDPAISATETTSLLPRPSPLKPSKSYGATIVPQGPTDSGKRRLRTWLGKGSYWIALTLFIAPLMFLACTICWALVFTVPMARLNWVLIKYLFLHPSHIRFCAAPVVAVSVPSPEAVSQNGESERSPIPEPSVAFKHARLSAGQAAPSGSPRSTVLLCVYRAFGWKYYKYTVGGVNIMFVNLLPVVFFVILDGWVLLPYAERLQRSGRHVPAFLGLITSRPLIFLMSLASVIPLSYFIGMAVASISAQSSIGMGAVINATFGSIIEIILYGIALTERKGHLVEGSIVGSLLAGVLLMPGMSMCSGAIRKKEMKFNAKSAGVTSMLLIMAFIGTIVPTLFYQTYGSFQLICEGCPDGPIGRAPWTCKHCYYEHPDPVGDPFYQSTVKTLMFFCAAVLLFSYLIGLWFSLRTHATQIWQNPQQLMHPLDDPAQQQHRVSIYQKLLPNTLNKIPSIHRKPSTVNILEGLADSRSQTPLPRLYDNLPTVNVSGPSQPSTSQGAPTPSQSGRRISYANPPVTNQATLTPLLESVDHAIKDTGIQPLSLGPTLTPDDFTRAVAVATVSALRHQQQSHSPARIRTSTEVEAATGGHGGHEAPSWSRTTSASVLLGCTALYAAIAEILVDVVDVVLEGSGIDEKFLGVTLFALVPNTTEFMNAISFAMNGNIALSMEIGSAYALQVCLLQIPAMVAFSAWYAPALMGSVSDTFTLIFPRWDVITIILSVFLMTYTYIEAKSNYHRGSILILSYLVLVSGFYFAPQRTEEDPFLGAIQQLPVIQSVQAFFTFR
ncbi:hypothetical protein BDY19DRAFT_894663 [Irpex rosettiformis]|uniref:Uncharacterized protein n=1 Tax=Irpex rosettiformis TaxID=378272 RepID=A0ACB8TX39_9APHY|nr:hypothetical protein BDY19DRAFT_894663 [Irpex rosettiformis]